MPTGGASPAKRSPSLSKTSDIISGIPGSGATPDGAPYALNEEFVSVYRMHFLMPDEILFFSATSGTPLTTLPDLHPRARSSSTRPPCHKSPSHLPRHLLLVWCQPPRRHHQQQLPRLPPKSNHPSSQTLDLGTIDILRDREHGIPRNCTFRRGLRLAVSKTFLELTGGNAALASELSEAYNRDIELVDALVGSHSEPVIPGFGFSETAFRIFILMGSRRLKADRFIAGDWNEETYTKVGFRWLQHTGMKDVLGRHYPELGEMLARTKGNVFAPWERVA